MNRIAWTAGLFLLMAGLLAPSAAGQADVDLNTIKTRDDVLKVLNNDEATVKGRADSKSYTTLFKAYLKLTKPPMPISESFHIGTVHAKMADWAKVSGWAESNPDMAKAILACKKMKMVGLPYGRENVESEFQSANLFVAVGEDESLLHIVFEYQPAFDTIVTFATAESYRLFEAGKIQEALDLSVANIWVIRQFCDRQFLTEKLHSIRTLILALSNLRDQFYVYGEKMTPEQLVEIAKNELPFLRPDRNQLLMPEADKLVAAAMIHGVFDSRGQADVDKFSQTFAAVQAKRAPLELFGAVRRWEMIAKIHASREASMERLKLVYDDWWRRWRLPPFDQLMQLPTQFERTNPVRYAAVAYSMEDIAQLFGVRNELIANVGGTAMAAGLTAYKRATGAYPDDAEKVYAQFVRKVSDFDPWDQEGGPLAYRLVRSDQSAVDTAWGRFWVEADNCILFAKGDNLTDDGAAQHSDDGSAGDLLLWPPVKAMLRQSGLLQ